MVIIGIGVIEGLIDVKLVGFFVMIEALDLSFMVGKDESLGASLLESFLGIRHLHLFKTIGDENSDFDSLQATFVFHG